MSESEPTSKVAGVAKKMAPEVAEVLIVFLMLGLAFVGALAGFLVGRGSAESGTTTTSVVAAEGHTGEALPPSAFGDPVRGAALFESKACADCHSFAGEGGTDAPPLDYMSGHLSASEVANMSGQIWNHLPAMLEHFEEEGIPVPAFEGDQMADLIAFLHSEQSSAP